MRVSKVLRRLAAKPNDRSTLRRVASAVGGELSQGRLETIRQFRKELARQASQEPFAQGYLSALDDVCAAYVETMQHERDTEDLQTAIQQAGWTALLLSLKERPKLPKELAAETNKDRAVVSRVLQRLRDADLVELYANNDTDRRTRPHRLTLRGELLAEKLSSLSSPVRKAVCFSVEALSKIAGRPTDVPEIEDVAKTAFSNEAESQQVTALLLRQACSEGLIAATDKQTYEWRSGDSKRDHFAALARSLIAAVSDPTPLPPFISALQQLTTASTRLLIRTHQVRDDWRRFLHRKQIGRCIDDADLKIRDVPSADNCVLVYDEPACVELDRDNPLMQELARTAKERYCVTLDASRVPEGFLPLVLDPS